MDKQELKAITIYEVYNDCLLETIGFYETREDAKAAIMSLSKLEDVPSYKYDFCERVLYTRTPTKKRNPNG